MFAPVLIAAQALAQWPSAAAHALCGSESSMLGRRSSLAPADSAKEKGCLALMQSVCRTSAEVARLLIAFSADVRMSVLCGASWRACSVQAPAGGSDPGKEIIS